MRLSGPGERHTGDFDAIAPEYAGLADLLIQAGVTPERLIRSLSPAELQAAETEARRSPFPPRRSLLSYWRIVVDSSDVSFEALRGALDRVPGVSAYEEEVSAPGYGPAVTSVDVQTYLEGRPDGVNARWAWDQGWFAGPAALSGGGAGRGLRIADLEQDWDEGHAELAAKADHVFGVRYGEITAVRHGTAVLGILYAGHGGGDIAGIAPDLNKVFLVSPALADGTYNTVDAIVTAALMHLSAGDVLLIEQEWGTSHTPLERVAADFDAIRLATALGRVVVELAGNGGVDLNTVDLKGFDADGTIQWEPMGSGDSGAIVVGAHDETLVSGSAGEGRQRRASSNFGDRVDCFGLGTGVTTLDSLLAGPWHGFNGTSSASAIIAGTVLVLQGIWAQTHDDERLAPWQIRALLREPGPDPAAGTVAYADTPTPVYGRIGDVAALKYVPNLARCAAKLGLTPDLHVRDYLGDEGLTPTEGVVCRSPDIIVTQNAQGDFGEGSGNEESDDLGSTAVHGADNWVYVRARNLGSATATDAKARVWWSEPALLITPADWNAIGEAVFPPIEGNASELAVAGPILWDSAPTTGHYCFVAVAGCPGDPAPVLPPIEDWDQFLEFIRANNSVAWRNFNVVDAAPAAGTFSATFLIRGAPDHRRLFTIGLEQRLPPGAAIELEVPSALAGELRNSPVVQSWRQLEEGAVQVRLSRLPRAVLFEARLAARAAYRVRLTISGLTGRLGGRVTLQQLFEGQPVGQLTYAFRSRPDRKSVSSSPSIQREKVMDAHKHPSHGHGHGHKPCKLCKGYEFPPAFKGLCDCLLDAFDAWYVWGEQVRAKLEEQDKILKQLIDLHDDIPEPPGGGGNIDPPPKPPFA